MSNKNLPPVDDLGKRDGAVVAPVVEGGDVVDEDNKVVIGSLVEDLGVCFVTARHLVVCMCVIGVLRIGESREVE